MDHWLDLRQAEEKKDVNIVSNVMKKAMSKEEKVASKLDTQPVDLEAVLFQQAISQIPHKNRVSKARSVERPSLTNPFKEIE